MMISPIGNSYGYYTTPYTSGATRGAALTAMQDMLHGDIASVQPADDVPEVFSNDKVERVPRTPKELEQDRKNAYEIMNSLTPRSADNLNPALKFTSDFPFRDKDIKNDSTPSEAIDTEECETCKNRTYLDGSNDNNVSFKAPGHISPEASASRVAAHEYEHVRNAYQEDKEEGKELVSVSVSLKTAICPECGKTYVAGGKTRTLMRNGVEENPYEKQQRAYENFAGSKPSQVDVAA